MLPPYIIQEIREREERQRAHREEQPRLELPIDDRPQKTVATEPEADRGLCEIQVWG